MIDNFYMNPLFISCCLALLILLFVYLYNNYQEKHNENIEKKSKLYYFVLVVSVFIISYFSLYIYKVFINNKSVNMKGGGGDGGINGELDNIILEKSGEDYLNHELPDW